MYNLELLEARNMLSANLGFRGDGQTVAIIDSGIAYDHVAVADSYVGGHDFAEQDTDPYDDGPAGGTGTHMAGIIAEIAPDADVVALRVFDDAGGTSFERIEAALKWVHENRDAFENPITTVNLSLASVWNDDAPPDWAMLEEELRQLEQDGIFVAAAAGNSYMPGNAPGLSYPAASPHVVPVMSVDGDNTVSYFSQRHERALAALGRGVNSAVPDYAGDGDGKNDDRESFSGTSVSTPQVAAAAVLIREAMAAAGRTDVDQEAIYTHIREHADVIFDTETNTNYRLLNLENSLEELAAQAPPSPEPVTPTPVPPAPTSPPPVSPTPVPGASLSARLFYNHSVFGQEPDTGKTPLRAGESAGPDNISGYVKGITGIVIELPKLPRGGSALTAADIEVRLGTEGDSSTWTPGPSPEIVIDHKGRGQGTDRVRLTFPDYSIVDTYVAITVLANENTGLASPYTLIFGSSVGDTGANATAEQSGRDAVDLQAIAQHLSLAVGIDNAYDLNKDGRVDALDMQVVARAGISTSSLPQL